MNSTIGPSLNYRIAEAVEVLTRKSTEAGLPPALKHYAEFIGTGERNLYKIIQRAKLFGFRFGVSVHYEKLDLALSYVVIDKELESNLPFKQRASTFDNAFIYEYIVSTKCLNKSFSGLKGARVYVADKVWGSRPALATLKFLSMSSEVKIDEGMYNSMLSLLKDVYIWGLPNIRGRRYPADALTVLLLMEADGDAVRSATDIARAYNLDPIKVQRKYYRLWRRKSILGFRIRKAPYIPGYGALLVVRHDDPDHLSYSLPVLPPIISAATAYPLDRPKERVVIVSAAGGGDMLRTVNKIISVVGGKVETHYYYYDVQEPSKDELEAVLARGPGAAYPCLEIK